ncbi:hypothetical protein VEE22_46970 (plasmid) [Escherichia coli]|nr:hypothetical protein VEE22_46970 [Escherichia coli]
MDAFNLLWSITGVAFIILIFVVLLCLLGFMTSAIVVVNKNWPPR